MPVNDGKGTISARSYAAMGSCSDQKLIASYKLTFVNVCASQLDLTCVTYLG
jgi:hypothetical protein